VRRRAPLPLAAALALGALAAATPLAAQRVTVGAQVASVDYREQGAELRFGGGGGAATLDAEWRRYGLRLVATRLALTGAGPGGASAEPFDLTQLDVRARLRVARALSVEAGWMTRDVEPTRAAQAIGAVRAGVCASLPLAPGADVTLRGGYLGATRFSGGGTAPFGAELGLGVSYGPGSGRVRAAADFEFQRIDRQTTIVGRTLDVPVQSAVGRLGVSFTP
jgi:hypothetical protein